MTDVDGVNIYSPASQFVIGRLCNINFFDYGCLLDCGVDLECSGLVSRLASPDVSPG